MSGEASCPSTLFAVNSPLLQVAGFMVSPSRLLVMLWLSSVSEHGPACIGMLGADQHAIQATTPP
jgi:hypothetical protein